MTMQIFQFRRYDYKSDYTSASGYVFEFILFYFYKLHKKKKKKKKKKRNGKKREKEREGSSLLHAVEEGKVNSQEEGKRRIGLYLQVFHSAAINSFVSDSALLQRSLAR
jgi:hypothetical protein